MRTSENDLIKSLIKFFVKKIFLQKIRLEYFTYFNLSKLSLRKKSSD